MNRRFPRKTVKDTIESLAASNATARALLKTQDAELDTSRARVRELEDEVAFLNRVTVAHQDCIERLKAQIHSGKKLATAAE